MLKTLLPEIHYYTQLAESLNQPVAIIDEESDIIVSNKKFCSLCGKEANEVEGKNFFSTLGNGECVKLLQEDLFIKCKSEEEVEYVHCGTDERIFMISANDLVTNDVTSSSLKVLFFKEITSEKINGQKLGDFISIASHELKSPIAIISAYSQIIEREAKVSSNPALRIFASKINQQSKKLVSLSSALLDISGIQTGRSDLKTVVFNLSDAIREVIENFSYTDGDYKILLIAEANVVIQADRQRISQVLHNLISNAIKYSPVDQSIIVKVSKKDGNVIVSVKDHGIGIPEDEQSKLFKRFSRTEFVGKENIPGSGLGLYICCEIVKKHRGDIWVESEIGKGSKFCFSLPVW